MRGGAGRWKLVRGGGSNGSREEVVAAAGLSRILYSEELCAIRLDLLWDIDLTK